jgi:SHS2 domain-containing protein
LRESGAARASLLPLQSDVYELVPHIADVRLHVSAASVEELFIDAVRGMYAVMGAESPGASRVERTIEVADSADRTALLVDFLNDVLHRAHVAGEWFDEVRFETLGETSLRALLTGTAPASFREDVKAVTYHEADLRLEDTRWATMLVFDI